MFHGVLECLVEVRSGLTTFKQTDIRKARRRRRAADPATRHGHGKLVFWTIVGFIEVDIANVHSATAKCGCSSRILLVGWH
jgi:hypothetical protein